MNQILVNEKVYVTPKLVRKKRFYKIQFTVCIIIVAVLISCYVYSVYDQRKHESYSQTILSDFDNTVIDDTLVVALNQRAEEVPTENQMQIMDQFNTVYKAPSGKEYKVDSILNIPSLGINYPILSETTNELLKISLTKFWGGEPNAVGNYCVVGHNYDGKDIFFGKLHKINNGDIVELKDKTGKTMKYKVYNKFIVKPNDVACTSQLTNGRKELTLITCSEGGKTRLIVKCRAE